MPLTPEEWLATFINNTTTAGSQVDPVVTGLSNGNFLVVWTDSNDTVASGTGTDIVGVIYDPEGNALTAPLFLNDGFGFSRSENDPAIAQTNDGGFVVVYEFSDGADNDLIFGRYDANGVRTDSDFVVNDTSSSAVYRDPSVAVSADNSFFVTYEVDDGTTEEIRGKKFDANGNVDGSEVTLRTDSLDGNPFDPDTVVLNDGRFVTVYRERDPFGGVDEYGIELRISNADGTNSTNLNVSTVNGQADSDPHVAALADGGWVVIWNEDNDIRGRLYEADGSSGSEFNITNTGNNDNEADVIGLADGTYVVVWDIDDGANGRLALVHRGDSGQLGTTVIVANDSDQPGSISSPEIGLTSDGRILVSWQHNSDIYTQIRYP